MFLLDLAGINVGALMRMDDGPGGGGTNVYVNGPAFFVFFGGFFWLIGWFFFGWWAWPGWGVTHESWWAWLWWVFSMWMVLCCWWLIAKEVLLRIISDATYLIAYNRVLGEKDGIKTVRRRELNSSTADQLLKAAKDKERKDKFKKTKGWTKWIDPQFWND